MGKLKHGRGPPVWAIRKGSVTVASPPPAHEGAMGERSKPAKPARSEEILSAARSNDKKAIGLLVAGAIGSLATNLDAVQDIMQIPTESDHGDLDEAREKFAGTIEALAGIAVSREFGAELSLFAVSELKRMAEAPRMGFKAEFAQAFAGIATDERAFREARDAALAALPG